jgi:hypothetical protein
MLPAERNGSEVTWIGTGASDALRGFVNESDYTTARARACYRLGYHLMEREIRAEVLALAAADAARQNRHEDASDRHEAQNRRRDGSLRGIDR